MKTWILPACIAVFALLSLVTIGSVRSDLLPRQLAFFTIGATLYFFARRVPFRRWLELRWLAYGLVIILLVLPLVLGHSSRNTSRWIELGTLRLQPSQLAIPLIGLSSVWLLGYQQLTFRRILIFLLTLMPPLGLIFISPDLGTAIIFLLTLGSLIWYAGASLRQLGLLALAGCCVVAINWLFILKPYQRERMVSFIAGTQAESQQHYNATQALIAVGNGKIYGTGWGKGTQSHLQFLPERQTDFIFSSYSEEYGFVGTTLVLLTILVTTIALFTFARQTNDKTAALYLLMAATSIFVQASVNIGMNIGLLPITGVTLPLISYGGSSVLATCLLLGVCGSIIRQHNLPPPRLIS